MEAGATISWGNRRIRTKLSPLQAAEIAAAKYGFFDVDCLGFDPGTKRYSIRASAPYRTVTAHGNTEMQAVENLLGMFVDG